MQTLTATDAFALACHQQLLITEATNEAVTATLDLDQRDPESGQLAAQAIATGIASLVMLHQPLLIAAIDLELAAA